MSAFRPRGEEDEEEEEEKSLLQQHQAKQKKKSKEADTKEMSKDEKIRRVSCYGQNGCPC